MAARDNRNWQAILDRQAGKKTDVTTSFVPKGRSGYVIYVVCLKEHPGVVKVGRTTKWKSRFKSYQCWNLSDGDAVDRHTVFTITEEFVDLPKLEEHVIALARESFKPRHGKEWFEGDYDDFVRFVDRIIAETSLFYEIT